jgi:hypothetical protein
MRLIEQDWTDIYAATATHYRWTLQEFARVAQRAAQLGVTPEVLPTITEDEFLARLMNEEIEQ